MGPALLRDPSQNANTLAPFQGASTQPLKHLIVKVFTASRVRESSRRDSVYPLLCFSKDQHPQHPPVPGLSWDRGKHCPEEADLPSEQGRGLSGGAGADRMLFPISAAPRAVDGARSLRHRGYTRSVNHAPSPLGGE